MKHIYLPMLVLLLLLSTFAVSAQADVDCNAPDYSGVEAAVAQADSALNSGDMAALFQARAQATTLYHAIENKCVLEPLAAHFGLDAATTQQLADMPSCQYLFDATVRSGANSGANVHGTLSLLQNSPTTAVGYVFSGSDGSTLVPVTAALGDAQSIILTFTLSDGGTIVGTGSTASSITNCFGAIAGTLTGPGKDDVGDWIGSAGNCVTNPLPCKSDDPHPKPQQPPSTGTCDANYAPMCMQICDNNGCRLECQNQVLPVCSKGGH